MTTLNDEKMRQSFEREYPVRSFLRWNGRTYVNDYPLADERMEWLREYNNMWAVWYKSATFSALKIQELNQQLAEHRLVAIDNKNWFDVLKADFDAATELINTLKGQLAERDERIRLSQDQEPVDVATIGSALLFFRNGKQISRPAKLYSSPIIPPVKAHEEPTL